MNKQLPINPNLEHLKKEAKKLLASAKNNEPQALEKIRRYKGGELSDLQLADSQFVVAREYGFLSWNKLKEEVGHRQKPHLKRAIKSLQEGKMCILFDDEGRENEGDFVLPATKVTAEALNFISKQGRGTTCLAITQERAEKLGIKALKRTPDSIDTPAFATSLDHIETHTGVSPGEKSITIKKVMEESSTFRDFRSPGHLFPLIENPQGIKARRGHTEGSLHLMRLAGLEEGAVICEIMNDDGTMARLPDLEAVAKKHKMELIKISDLI